jgi:hypothetical protein
VAALVFGATQAVHTLLVSGRPIVDGAELRTADESRVAADLARASRRLADRASGARR